MPLSAQIDAVVQGHQRSGSMFRAGGLESFALDSGEGPAVVCVHGVPASSFLYRKVVPLIAAKGLRAVAFDLPGLGLAERPQEFDYSWSGLAGWFGDALDSLGIERCHLVVHDIGGPIGCEWAVRNPDRVLSLTALNTLLKVATFKPPWSMRPFRSPRLGPLWLRSMSRVAFTQLFYLQGIADHHAVSRAEVGAHYSLLKRIDGGQAFLRIMRGFELTADKERLLTDGLAARRYPAQLIWGIDDPALGQDRLAEAEGVLSPDGIRRLDAKHFLPEDHADEIAAGVGELALGA